MKHNLAKIEAKDINEIVYEELKKAIIGGSLSSGSSLVERELASTLGVSRTPVHEALNRLETERLVQRLPNKRVVVARVSRTDLVQLYTIRSGLEELAVSWAMPNLNKEIISKLRLNLKRMAQYREAEDGIRVAELNYEFHNIIVEASQSMYLSMFMKNIQDAARLFRGHAVYLPGRVASIVADHTALVQAMEDRDQAKALLTIRSHVQGALDALLVLIDTNHESNNSVNE